MICLFCRKKFTIYPAWIRKAKKFKRQRFFCSRDCYLMNGRIKNRCKNCKKVFLTIKAVPRFYCNSKCYDIYRGKNMTYGGLHNWVKRMLGKPFKCENCGAINRKIEWANKSHKYKKELDDWLQLCVPCHKIYDKRKN